MNPHRLTGLLEIINQQIPKQEAVLEALFKAEAMLSVLSNSDLQAHSALTLHNYLWQMSDIIEKAKGISEHLLDILLGIKNLTGPSSPPNDGTMH